MRLRLGLALAASAAAIGGISPAYAQQHDEGAEIDALLDASATAEGALALAGQQEAEGDLTGAAATLERALIDHGGAASIRVRYAALLCRLDDPQRARLQLAQIKGDRSEAQAACGNVQLGATEEAPRSNSWIRGQLAAGLAYDTNAAGALTAQFDIPGGTLPKEDGVAFVASGSLDARFALSDNVFFYGGLDAVTRNHLGGPDYDYQVGTLNAGFGYRGSRFEVSAGGILRHAIVSGDSYVTEYGGEAQAVLLVGETARFKLRGEILGQDYRNNFFLFSRDGTRYDVALDFGAGAADRFSYVVGGAWERKTAETDELGYKGFRLYAAARAPLSEKVYGTIGANYRHMNYDDALFGPDIVEDRFFGRAGIGYRLTPQLAVEGAATYTKRDYNPGSLLRDFDNVGGELRLVFSFGR